MIVKRVPTAADCLTGLQYLLNELTAYRRLTRMNPRVTPELLAWGLWSKSPSDHCLTVVLSKNWRTAYKAR